MKHVQQNQKNPKKRRISAVQAVRAAVQLAAFLLIPGLFISVFSGIGSIYTAIIGGSFVLSEQLGNILLFAAVFLVTALWGRFFCGFICSFGAMQDLLWRLGKHIVRKPIVPEKADRVLKYLKYAVLAFIVLGVWTFGLGSGVTWSPWAVFGMYASPFKGFPAVPVFLSVGGLLLLLTVIGSVLIERFFCKYLCPLGALFSLASHFRLFRIRKPASGCGNCRLCTKKCSMSIPLYRSDEVRSGECIDCMQCTGACYRGNVKAAAAPAVSGTLAAAAIAGVTFMGTLQKTEVAPTAVQTTAPAAILSTEAVGRYKDGAYTGTANGYRGEVQVTVRVSSGFIREITVDSSRDDSEFINKAQQRIIPAIIEAQDTDVATVSGATYSSRGIIDAVQDALDSGLIDAGSQAQTDAPVQSPAEDAAEAPAETETEAPAEATDTPDDSDDAEDGGSDADVAQGGYTDGVYYGSGSGFRGTTQVEVTVAGGRIADITVTSYDDDYQFFSRAQSGVIDAILSEQSVDVSTVSGATYSSNSIKEAVADALGLSFSNPNGSGGSHRRR